MTGGSFVFFHPTVKNNAKFSDFSPPGEHLILNLTLSKEQRILRLNVVATRLTPPTPTPLPYGQPDHKIYLFYKNSNLSGMDIRKVRK